MSPGLRFDRSMKSSYSPMRDYIRLAVMLVMLVVVLAIFYMLQSQVQQTQRAAKETPPAVTTQLEPSVPSAAPVRPSAPSGEEEEKKLLARIRDDAPIEIQPYYYMLAKVFNMSQEQIESKVNRTLIPFDCLAEPEKHRGQFLRFDGSLWRLREVKMNPASGFESVYEGTVARQGPPGGPFVYCTVILTQKPGPKLQPMECNVLFSGVFLKRIVYENIGEADEQGRRNLTMSPLFIGKQISLAPPLRAVTRTEAVVFVLIGLAALLVFAYFVLFASRWRGPERHFELPPETDLEVVPDDAAVQESEPEAPKESEAPSQDDKEEGSPSEDPPKE